MRTYANGVWDKTPTTLDDAKDINDLYRRLATLGFSAYDELTCRTGDIRLYYRHGVTGKKMFQFDYCCMLYIGGYICTVLLADLPDVYLYLKEIDARPKKQEALSVEIENIAELKIVLQQVVRVLNEIKNSGIPKQMVSASARNNSQHTDETIFEFEDISFAPEHNNAQNIDLEQ